MKKIALKAGLDPTLPDVSLEIGGKERQLAFDMAAIAATERLTGLNLMKAAQFTNLSFTELSGLLYAALLHDEPELKLADVSPWIHPRNVGVIQLAIAEAWFGSVSSEKDPPSGEAQAQAQK